MSGRSVFVVVAVMTASLGACEPAKDSVSCADQTAISDGEIWPPPAMVRSSGTQIVSGSGDPLALRCVNVDGWLRPIPYLVSDSGNALFTSPTEFMERLDDVVGAARANAFWTDWRDRFITGDDFARMHAIGFNCARLVIYHRSVASVVNGQIELDEAGLAYVDKAVVWAREHRVYLVLDLHSAPGGQNALPTVGDVASTDAMARLWTGPEAATNQAATVALWRALANRYRAETVIAGYDLLNEPALPDGVDKSALVALYSDIIAAIREVDAGHMLFLEGDELAHDFSMFTAPLDGNMAYSFHAYALTGFEDWATPDLADLQPYLDLRAAHGRPLWLGEFGEQSREWQAKMVSLMDAHGIGWALYPWKRKQTFFWNPVIQQVPDMPKWYALASWLALAPKDTRPPPNAADAEAGMAEALASVALSSTREDLHLVEDLLCP